MAKVLVTGASGLLGANAVLELKETHQVLGVYCQHTISDPDIRTVRAELSNPAEVDRLFTREQPEWVIHCAAAANVDACERDPEMAFRLNRDMAGYVAKTAAKIHARLVHISTDLVFDGEDGNYSETDPPNPINVYGRSKLEGEQAVLESCPSAVVIRTNLYGWNARDKHSLAEWFLYRLRSKVEVSGFTDMYSSPILVNHLVKIILNLFDLDYAGIIHIGGQGCISKYGFGCEIARLYDLDPSEINPSSWRDLDLYAQRAENLCLNTSNAANSLSIRLPTISEGLAAWKRLEFNGYLEQLKALTSESDSNQQASRNV